MNVNDRSGFDVPLKVVSLPLSRLWIFYQVHVSRGKAKSKRGAGGWGGYSSYDIVQYSYPAVLF